MLPSPGNPIFGDYRMIDGVRYELVEEVRPISGETEEEALKLAKSQAKEDYVYVRVLTSKSGVKAVYGRNPNET